MAKVRSITIGLNRKMNDGHYGTFGAEYQEVVELEDGDNQGQVVKEALVRCKRILRHQLIETEKVDLGRA